MENLIVIPDNEKQLLLLKAMLAEMRIKFKIGKSLNNQNSELEENIDQARTEKEKGVLMTINPHSLWESI